MREVRIPEERVGVLIGKGGRTKEDFEEYTDCDLQIEDNNAIIDGEPLEEMVAANIVKAIGRGFSAERAFQLLEEDKVYHQIDINRYANTKNSRERLKGRVIGKEGETRIHIQKMTEVEISVYGKTVGLIGRAENIEIALEAIKMLLNGSSHSAAYTFLEKNQEKITR